MNPRFITSERKVKTKVTNNRDCDNVDENKVDSEDESHDDNNDNDDDDDDGNRDNVTTT